MGKPFGVIEKGEKFQGSIKLRFRNEEDFEEFFELTGIFMDKNAGLFHYPDESPLENMFSDLLED